MQELVSIVVPVYNVERYLPKCIDSLLRQTYKNIEILLINDGSTDKSKEICEEYAQNNSNILFYSKKNGGLSSARNFGIEKASGSYIMFVDSDDFIAENMVQALYDDMKDYNADISSVGLFMFYDDDNSFPIKYDKSKTEVFDNEEALKCILNGDAMQDYAWNKMYNIKLFENIRFPDGYLMEDLGTAYLLIDAADKITYNPAQLYYYYQRNGSILHNVNPKLCTDKYIMAKKRFHYLKSKYPKCLENDRFMLSVLMRYFNYICTVETDNKIFGIWKMIDKKCLIHARLKFKIKYLLFYMKYSAYRIGNIMKK